MSTITLTASADFGQQGQYVAQIKGRMPKVQFAREFVGRKSGKRNDVTSYETDETGLYEVRDCTRKGKVTKYWLVLAWADGELVKLRSDQDDALAIAKRLDAGEKLEEFVIVEKQPMTKSVSYRTCAACGRRIEMHCEEHPDATGQLQSEELPVLDDAGIPRDELVYSIRKPGEVKKATAAATFDEAVALIVVAVQALPSNLQRKALNAAKAQLFPKAAADETSAPAEQ